MRLIYGALHTSVIGVAAVMVFFVISGFCIHYPFRHGETPHWGEYFLRRYIRIGIPLLTAWVLIRLVTGDLHVEPLRGVIWSLYAEIIYYTLYPLLMAAKRRFGWQSLFLGTGIAAAVVVAVWPHTAAIQDFGVTKAWIVGLPIWLMGCLLAEQSDGLLPQRVPSIWAWRAVVWVLSCLCGILRFHTPIGYPWTLPLFSILVFFWLRQEIRHFRFAAPPAFLEKAGAWSYSLYLLHNFAGWCFEEIPLPFSSLILRWLLKLAFACLMAYLFFLLVERPSHLLARRVKQGSGRPARPAELEGGPKEPQGIEMPDSAPVEAR